MSTGTPTRLRELRTTAIDPLERGLAAGAALRDEIARIDHSYRALFRVLGGVGRDEVLRFGEAVLRRVEAWRPTHVEELRGVAAGSGQPLELVAALNARTELVCGQECSLVGRADGPDGPWLAQNWDWYVDVPDACVLWHAETEGGRFLTMTEAGMLAKVGISSRGIATGLNILKHRDDGGPPGVPVHLVLREILATCTTVDDVASLLAECEMSASSALSVVDAHGGAATFEVSSAGIARLDPRDGLLVHANHFLDPALAEGEANELWPGSEGRVAALRAAAPETLEDAQAVLAGHGCTPQSLCRHDTASDPGLPDNATLVSLAMRPAGGTMDVAAGTPCTAPFVRYALDAASV